MKKILLTSMAIGSLLIGMGSTAHADLYSKQLYIVGSSPPGLAQDSAGNPTFVKDENGDFQVGGIELITWDFDVATAGWATLTIVAEGVDGGQNAPYGGEFDEVSFNGFFLGYLTQQDLYSSSYKLQPGAGSLANITELTTTMFFNIWAEKGINTVTIKIDPHYWVNEIETSTLTVNPVPEPTTFLLFATGLAGLAATGRKKRN